MATKTEILDAALDVIAAGEVLTLDSVARRAGLTKPGIVHHFATKEILATAVIHRLADLWDESLRARAGEGADARARLIAYAEHALMGDLGPADVSVLADVRLREKLTEEWVKRLDPWFGAEILSDARAHAVRFLADGAWFGRSMGTTTMSEQERASVLEIARRLMDEPSE